MGTPLDTREAQATELTERLHEAYPDATISLNYATRLELLVAVILSGQCTDERVNAVTPELFETYESAEDYVDAGADRLAEDISSITYPNQKAGWIVSACERIVTEHDGAVPDTMDQLTALDGVDTHVQRLTRRLGLTERESPEAIERDLIEVVPESEWRAFTHLCIAHGRATCTARSPDCESCVLADVCPSERGSSGVDLATGEPWGE